MKNHFCKSCLILLLLAAHSPVFAEDIDLFVSSPTAAADLPNLMIVLDNAANFSASTTNSCIISGSVNSLQGTTGGIEQCALYKVIEELAPLSADADKAVLNLGVMVYNANNIRDIHNQNCGGTTGGCLMVPLTKLDKANKASVLAWIKSWKTSTGTGDGYIKANGQATAAAMQETWAYYAGHTGISGRSYASIKPEEGCQKNFVVFVGNSFNNSGTPGDANNVLEPLYGTSSVADKNVNPAADTSQKTLILNSKSTTCGSHTFTSASHVTKGHGADEYARYMAGQKITTYTIGVLGPSCQAEYAALLTNMAEYGGGIYFPTTNYDALVTAFQSILSQIQTVNSVFASVSLPVSVNTQGTYLNQVYVGMFRPDKDALPRWQGNLKQYKFGLINSQLELVDAEGNSAISAGGSGFIAECAVSMWTQDSEYWVRNTKENCVGDLAKSDKADGNLVEKGGQAYMLRKMTEASRNMKTCTGSCSGTSNFGDFNAANVGILLDGVASGDRTKVINWMRGLNTRTDDSADNFVSSSAMRPSVHGDVVHSRPVAIDYASADAGVVVFYGGNDGVFRAVDGDRDGGSEFWSFVPSEFYPKINRIYKNQQTISFPGFVTTSATPPGPKDYGMDGPVTAYRDNAGTYVFATMRRGGDAVYAFDVTAPRSPSILWKFKTVDGAQTWSSLKTLKAKGYTDPMVIMGGGYDPTCHDPDASCASTSVGNKVYLMDAKTGDVLNSFSTGVITNSIIADATVVPDGGAEGYAKYIYVADLGGNVYRISGVDANSAIGETAPENWTITKVAAVGGSGINRKFMFAPDVVDENGIYVLLLGSGDREKPLEFYDGAASVNNRFYAIKDKPSDANWLVKETDTCGSAVICDASLYPIVTSSTPTPAQLATKEKGWYLSLDPQEQVVTSAITVFGTVTFSTHKPYGTSEERCSPTLGTATVYNINYKNAAPALGFTLRGSEIAGGGLPPSPVAGVVELDDGTQVPFLIGGNPESALQGGKPPSPPTIVRPKSRVYWNIKK